MKTVFVYHCYGSELQKDFSINSENYINNQVRDNTICLIQQKPNIKEIALDQINFWQEKFDSHIKELQNIKNKL